MPVTSRRICRFAAPLGLLLAAVLAAPAQTAPPALPGVDTQTTPPAPPAQTATTTQTAPPAGTPTIAVQSRLVVEDVLAFDAHDRPVYDLPQSAFHVSDQGVPQTIRSFRQDAEPPSAPAHPLPAGTFTNAVAATDRSASEVLLVDADSLSLTEQMFLLAQLRQSLRTLPSALQVALFRVTAGRPVQIRGFTTDRNDLSRALGECLPFQNHTTDSRFVAAIDTLMTVTAFLDQVPGRKNLLWFAGEFPLIPVAAEEWSPTGLTVDYASRQHIIHQVQEALAEARISVYPVDVRGVINYDLQPLDASAGTGAAAGRDPAASSGMTAIPTVPPPAADGVAGERDQMRQLATATGGHAYMRNDLSTEISEAFQLGLGAYTLSYTPSPYANDDTWHRVRITVDSPYHLSYRTGYLASDTGLPGGRQGFRLEDGERVSTAADSSHPLLQPVHFVVQVHPVNPPGSHAHDPLRVSVDFSIPAREVDFHHAGDTFSSQVLVCSYAYNSDGRMRGGKLQELDTVLSPAQFQRAQGQQLAAHQTLEIPHDAGYLLFAVRDRVGRRIGSYLLSMRAVRALPPEIPAAAPSPGNSAPASSAAASSHPLP